MSDKYELLNLIKRAAVEAVENMHPCNFVFGNVIKVVKDIAGKVIELQIQIDSKLILELEFLVFGESLPKEALEEKDKVILIQKAGGQSYYVADILGGDEVDT